MASAEKDLEWWKRRAVLFAKVLHAASEDAANYCGCSEAEGMCDAHRSLYAATPAIDVGDVLRAAEEVATNG